MEDNTRKKKRGRSNIFRSCAPSSTAGEKLFPYEKSDRRNAKNGRLRKSVLMAVSGRKGRDTISDVNGGGDRYYKRSSHHRIVSRILKSVWFDSLMVKKINRRSLKSSISSHLLPFLSIENTGKSYDDNENSPNRCSNSLSPSSQTTCSSSNPNSFFSSSTSNQNTSSPTSSDNFRLVSMDSSNTVSSNSNLVHKRKIKTVGDYSNIRVCLFFLLSLVVLIVYGRIYSILFTSAWLYILPSHRIKRVDSTAASPETDSYKYKKRVIMAALLDRARNPFR